MATKTSSYESGGISNILYVTLAFSTVIAVSGCSGRPARSAFCAPHTVHGAPGHVGREARGADTGLGRIGHRERGTFDTILHGDAHKSYISDRFSVDEYSTELNSSLCWQRRRSSRGGRAPPLIDWPLQLGPHGRCPFAGGGWPRWKRTSWEMCWWGIGCPDGLGDADRVGTSAPRYYAEDAAGGNLFSAGVRQLGDQTGICAPLSLDQSLQTVPRGRCPPPVGGWPRRNRAAWEWLWRGADGPDDRVDVVKIGSTAMLRSGAHCFYDITNIYAASFCRVVIYCMGCNGMRWGMPLSIRTQHEREACGDSSGRLGHAVAGIRGSVGSVWLAQGCRRMYDGDSAVVISSMRLRYGGGGESGTFFCIRRHNASSDLGGVLDSGCGPRSERPLPPSGGCPVSQLYLLADAAVPGCGWRWSKRSTVAPPAAEEALATGVSTSVSHSEGRGVVSAAAAWLPQLQPVDRRTHAWTRWPSRKRADWYSDGGGQAGPARRCRIFASSSCTPASSRSRRHRLWTLSGGGTAFGGGRHSCILHRRFRQAVGGPCGPKWNSTTIVARRRRIGPRSVGHQVGILDLDSELMAVALWLVTLIAHAAAVLGGWIVGGAPRRGACRGKATPEVDGHLDRAKRSVVGRRDRDKAWRMGRVAVAATQVGNRRYAVRRCRHYQRVLILGEPSIGSTFWTPWRSEVDASRGEASLGGHADGGIPWQVLSHRCGAGAGAWSHRGPTCGDKPAADINSGAGARRRKGSRPRTLKGTFRGRTAFVSLALATLLAKIGEAAGTSLEQPGVHRDPVTAEWVKMRTPTAASYPSPHRDGFRDVSSPGFEDGERVRTAEGDGSFGLVAETVNSTGWGALQRRLQSTDAHVVCAQETWVLQGQLKAASDWARHRGWEAVWAPAKLGSGGGASGGVAVFARRGLGLRFPSVGSHILEDARAVAAVCEPPGHRPILVCSAYLIDGQGVREPNKAILSKIGAAIAAQGNGCLSLVGADFQCSPATVDSAGFPDLVGGRILAAATARGTFRTSSAATNLDFFVAGGGLADVVDRVRVVETSGIKGHVLVQVIFQPRPVALRHLTVRQPPPLGIERVVGPLPAPPSWDASRAAADSALALARDGANEVEVQDAIDKAYQSWCQDAEAEVADANSTTKPRAPKKLSQPTA